MIIIEPFGGLANRMRVIASAMDLSNKTKQKIKLIWVANYDLNCEFLDLFKPIKDIEITNKISKYKFAKATNQESKFKRIFAYFINKIVGIDYCIKEKDFEKYVWNRKIDLLEIVSRNKNIYFQTCEELNFEKNEEFYLNFMPIDNIQNVINQITNSYDKDTVGIHIRRADNYKSIEFSPTTLFIENMINELKVNPNTNFFLATDDLETENELIEKFTYKIITYKKELSRNTKKGIIDALIDLYCLSKTKYIFVSYLSSFSDIASRIGKIEVVTIKK